MLLKLQKKYNIDLLTLTLNLKLKLNLNNFNSFSYIATLHLDLLKSYLYLCKDKGLNKCFYHPDVNNAGHRFSDSLFESEVLFSGYNWH